jgi:hypothetical protein
MGPLVRPRHSYWLFKNGMEAYEIAILSACLTPLITFGPVCKLWSNSVTRLCHWRWPRCHTFNHVASIIPMQGTSWQINFTSSFRNANCFQSSCMRDRSRPLTSSLTWLFVIHPDCNHACPPHRISFLAGVESSTWRKFFLLAVLLL